MTWYYQITTGQIRDEEGQIAIGYSGHGEGLNNPAFQQVHNVGPIPCGDYEIVGPPVDTASHGPFVMRLEPKPGTETYGRSGFLLHGDSLEHAGEHLASEGCVVVSRGAREVIWESGDRDWRVVE